MEVAVSVTEDFGEEFSLRKAVPTVRPPVGRPPTFTGLQPLCKHFPSFVIRVCTLKISATSRLLFYHTPSTLHKVTSIQRVVGSSFLSSLLLHTITNNNSIIILNRHGFISLIRTI